MMLVDQRPVGPLLVGFSLKGPSDDVPRGLRLVKRCLCFTSIVRMRAQRQPLFLSGLVVDCSWSEVF